MKKNATTPRPVSANQAVGTPWEFIRAVINYRGPLYCDLAAIKENKKAPYWIGPDEGQDEDYRSRQVGHNFFETNVPAPPFAEYNWLNPPFAVIEPWLQKVAEEALPTLILVPASVGSSWYGQWVEGRMGVSFLCPRLTFEGHTSPYPKDLMLLTHNPQLRKNGLMSLIPRQWRWK